MRGDESDGAGEQKRDGHRDQSEDTDVVQGTQDEGRERKRTAPKSREEEHPHCAEVPGDGGYTAKAEAVRASLLRFVEERILPEATAVEEACEEVGKGEAGESGEGDRGKGEAGGNERFYRDLREKGSFKEAQKEGGHRETGGLPSVALENDRVDKKDSSKK